MFDTVHVEGPEYVCSFGHAMLNLQTKGFGSNLAEYWMGSVGDPIEGESPVDIHRPFSGRYIMYENCPSCNDWTEFRVVIINDIVVKVGRCIILKAE